MSAVVIDWIAYNADRQPEKIAAIDLASERHHSYARTHDRVGRMAAWLAELGVGPGDRVGVLALNSTDTLELLFATWRLGAVHLALNFRLTAPELDYIIGDAEPRVIVYDHALLETVEQLRAPAEHWIGSDGMGGESELEARTRAAAPIERMTPCEPEDQCVLMYSSGTTGRPKGVIITHRMMLFSAINALGGADLGADSVNLAVMPLFHIGGLNVFAAPTLYVGGTVAIMRSFDPGATLAAFDDRRLGVTHFLGVPAIFNALRDHPANAQTDFSRLQTVICGAEAVPEALVRWWYEQRGVRVQEGYGMTENSASAVILPRRDVPAKAGAAGKPLRHVELAVFRADGTPAEVGESGEICCRGPVVTPGYWRRPDADAEVFLDDWLRTGDVGRRDAQGYFHVEDRVKDMYISGGENVYPAEVENVLYELEAIREVAVIGVPDERWGETGCAVVVLHDDTTLSPEAVRAHCEGRLARYKHPRHVVFVDALPRNATGKVLKFELRQRVQVA